MNKLKPTSFGNSPQTHPKKPTSQHSFNPQKPPHQNYFSSYIPYTDTDQPNIPQLKKQMQDALYSGSRRSGVEGRRSGVGGDGGVSGSRRRRGGHRKYPSEISLMQSDVSLLSFVQPYERVDLSLSLLGLQVGVTEQILALKQDKITLMAQYNKIIQRKYQAERQITKLKIEKQRQSKGRQSSDVNELSIFDNQHSSSKKKTERNDVYEKNLNLKSQYQYLVGQNGELPKQEQERVILQIQNIQQSSRIIRQKILKIEQNTRPDEQQRFQTFFPQKKSPPTSPPPPTVPTLRSQRTQLLHTLSTQAQSPTQKQILLQLIQQNQQLTLQLEKLTKKYRGSNAGAGILGVEFLRERVREEQEAKRLFFEDLGRFKEEAKRFRGENEDMRGRLGL